MKYLKSDWEWLIANFKDDDFFDEDDGEVLDG